MLVVADTSPINDLVLVEQTAVLPALYSRVLLPPAVVTELQDAEAPVEVRTWVGALPAWCAVRRPASADPET
jgi:predicted nucleic acid-binding protein